MKGHQGQEGFSESIVFVDESGDHGLVSIDPSYPLFVLVFCILKKEDYRHILVPALQEFKMRHFGHDGVIFHEPAIRKGTGDFAFLNSREKKEAFMEGLTKIIAETPFFIASLVLHKERLKMSETPGHPYHMALKECLAQTHRFLAEQGDDRHSTHLLFEMRGKKEDGELREEFERIRKERGHPFEMVFVDKRANHLGLQLADLVARPIGLSCLRPDQPNRTYGILEKKRLPLTQVDGLL
jgi:hypothetical protein